MIAFGLEKKSTWVRKWIKGQNTIKKIIISKGIEEIGDWAFAGTLGVVNIDIPNSVTRIGKYAFGYCQNLTDVVLPDSVTNIENYAFDFSSALTTVGLLFFEYGLYLLLIVRKNQVKKC